MPISTIRNFGSGSGSPFTYIPPTAGDIEESRVKRLLDLAQLSRLTNESNFQQEQSRLGWAKFQDERQGRLDALLSDQRKQAIDLRGQDVMQRGQDQSTMDKREELKSARLGDLMHVYGAQANPDMGILGATLAASGMPEFQNALAAKAGQASDAKLTAALTAYGALSPDKQPGYLKSLATDDPTTASLVQQHLTKQAAIATNAGIAAPDKRSYMMDLGPASFIGNLGSMLNAPPTVSTSTPTETPSLSSLFNEPDYTNDPEIQKLLPQIRSREQTDAEAQQAADELNARRLKSNALAGARYRASRAAGVYEKSPPVFKY